MADEKVQELRRPGATPKVNWDDSNMKSVYANVANDESVGLRLQVMKQDGREFRPTNQAETDVAVALLEAGSYRVDERNDKPTRTKPTAPYITSTLQQAASTRLGFGVKKTMVLAGGGGALVLGLAFLFAMMGVPGNGEERAFAGPFVAPLTAEKVQVNLLGGKGYLILDLNVVYQAYDEAYFTERSLDPLTIAEIRDALVTLASAKSKDDISDKVSKPIFMEEIRVAVEPLPLGNDP